MVVVLLRRTARLTGQERREPLDLGECPTDDDGLRREPPDGVEQVEVQPELGRVVGVAGREGAPSERASVGVGGLGKKVPGRERF